MILRGRTREHQGLYYILCGVKTRALTVTYSLPQVQGSETQLLINPDAYVMSCLNVISLVLTRHTVNGI
jgi:hypothetical protein